MLVRPSREGCAYIDAMDEILEQLPSGTRVLDLGSASGSFARERTKAITIRLDRECHGKDRENVLIGDAAHLPFADGRFQAVISNHSLEHFEELERCLREVGRVISPRGALFVSVPDASTLTDKLYRWLASGGGHVNPFVSPESVIRVVEDYTGLKHVATKGLCSSLSFLNRRNSPAPRPKRTLLIGGGFEWTLRAYVWFSRRVDRLLGTRLSIYGWAFYFGEVSRKVNTTTWLNVCVRCGSGASALFLRRLVKVRLFVLKSYACPSCGASNPFIDSDANWR